MAITDEVLNELLKDYEKPEDLLGKDGLLKQLQKRLLEKALGAELTDHLGYRFCKEICVSGFFVLVFVCSISRVSAAR